MRQQKMFRTDYSYDKQWIYSNDVESLFNDEIYNDLINGLDVDNFRLQRLVNGQYVDCDLWGDLI